MSSSSKKEEIDVQLAIKALLSVVEGGSDISKEGDDYNCRSLIRLFEVGTRKEAIIAGCTAKQQKVLLHRALKTCHKNQLKRFFNNVQSIVDHIIEQEAFCANSIDEDNNANESSTQDVARSKECLVFLKHVASCVHSVIDARNQDHQPDSTVRNDRTKKPLSMLPQVFDVALAMHDILFALHACGERASSTKTAVLNLCEAWWLANGERRESLIVQCLPLLVLRACEEHDCFNNKTHIQRLYKLRDAFFCIDFSDPSSEYLRKLVLRLSSNPLCLKLPEGKKLLSSLLQDVNLVKDLHLSFRAQLPTAKESVLQAYGEIYHRAWRDSKDISGEFEDSNDDVESISIRHTIEHEVLQELMYAVIHVASSKTFQSIVSVLETIHVDKKNQEVANMMYRLYNPILWRSLRAANPRVRQNAVTMLEKVFPLYDPFHKHGNDAIKEAVLKGSNALRDALVDNDPNVRVAALRATGKIFAVFWEVLPPGEIRTLLSIIVLDLSSDKRSAAVRAASVETISVLLETDRSHGVVRPLLPNLGNLIHDKAEKVRLAVVKMLIRIKAVPGIRFYHVVPVDHLLARLTLEADIHSSPYTPVTQELTDLLLSSYLPQGDNVSVTDQLKRTLTFLITNPGASEVFYANVTKHLELESVVKLILVLSSWLKSAVDSDQVAQLQDLQLSKKRQRSQPSNHALKRKSDNIITMSPDRISADNTRVMAGLSNIINVLWESILPHLNEEANSASRKILESYFSGKDFNLLGVLSHFEQKGSESPNNKDGNVRRNECFRTCAWMLACAGRLGNKCSREIVTQISTSLRGNSKEISNSCVPLVISYFSYLCSAGFANDVAASLATSIESSFGNTDFSLLSPAFEEATARRRSRRTSFKKTDDGIIPLLPPSIGWVVIDSILQGVVPESKRVREIFLTSDAASSAFMEAFRKGIQHAERLLGTRAGQYGFNVEKDEVEYVVRACEAYGRFAIHKQFYSSLTIDEIQINNQVEMLVKWTTKIVVPAIQADEKASSALQDLDLSHISNASDSLVHLPLSSPSLTSPPKQKQNLGRTPEAMRGRSSLFDVSLNDAPMTSSKRVAVSLLVSTCLISSELVAMRVYVPEIIATASVYWCDVFEDLDASMLEALLPAFTRLGVQLKMEADCTTLLERLFVVCNKYLTGADCNSYVVLKAASQSIISRHRQEVESFVSLFLNVVDQIVLGDQNDFLPIEKIDNMSQVWQAGGSIAIFLDVIDINKHVQLILAQTLATTILKSETREKPSFRFKVQCLVALSGVLEKRSFADIFEGLGYENIDNGNDIENLVKNLVESCV